MRPPLREIQYALHVVVFKEVKGVARRTQYDEVVALCLECGRAAPRRTRLASCQPRPSSLPWKLSALHAQGHCKQRQLHSGQGGATPWFWTPTTPQLTVGRRPLGGGIGGGVQGGAMRGGGGSRRGLGGGALREGRLGGGPGAAIWGVGGGGGSRWSDLGCWRGEGGHRLPLPPLALPLTIPSP